MEKQNTFWREFSQSDRTRVIWLGGGDNGKVFVLKDAFGFFQKDNDPKHIEIVGNNEPSDRLDLS